MNRFLRLRNFLIGGVILLFIIIGATLQDEYRKTARFRTMQDPIPSTEKVDLKGLRELPIAGGPILSLRELKERLPHIKDKKLIIVDSIKYKSEYIQGIPTCYLGYKEWPSLKNLAWRLFYTRTLYAHPELTKTEAQEAEKNGFGYANFEIGSKVDSSDQTVDAFIKFFDALPKDAWVYFHCHHGKGRTSVMLVMADIMKNAPHVALPDIIKRQHLLGSVDLFDTTPWTRSTYAASTLKKRKKFIQNFYEFICQRKADGLQSWTEWRTQQQGKK